MTAASPTATPHIWVLKSQITLLANVFRCWLKQPVLGLDLFGGALADDHTG
jgi:hypothetical protein